jgi:hypothetical protein
MIWNVVVVVNTSMSAAASTPVYFAMMGAAARSVTVSRWAWNLGARRLAACERSRQTQAHHQPVEEPSQDHGDSPWPVHTLARSREGMAQAKAGC